MRAVTRDKPAMQCRGPGPGVRISNWDSFIKDYFVCRSSHCGITPQAAMALRTFNLKVRPEEANGTICLFAEVA